MPRSPGFWGARNSRARFRSRREPGREIEQRPYVNPKIACPEFGPNGLRCRLVKLEQPAEDGATYIVLWEPRDR
jgi:hypothetical protein